MRGMQDRHRCWRRPGVSPQERLLIAVGAVATMERTITETLNYVRERKVFGEPLLAMQNTRFRLAKSVFHKLRYADCWHPGMKRLIADKLWALVQPLLPPHAPHPKGGRPFVEDRAPLTGMVSCCERATLGDAYLRVGPGLGCDVLAASACLAGRRRLGSIASVVAGAPSSGR